MMTKSGMGIVALLAAAAGPALAQSAPSPVVDGDTLQYNGATVHLWGVYAPEIGQTCADGWPAGRVSADYLAHLVQGRKLTCEPRQSPSTGGSAYALCKADGQDLGAAMAEAGMAWSNPSQTKDYSVQETNAMIQVNGIHAHDCTKAWEWRSRQLPSSW